MADSTSAVICPGCGSAFTGGASVNGGPIRCWACSGYTASRPLTFEAAYARGRDEERAAVVAFLDRDHGSMVANRIKRGEHLA